jgi:AraC-like DNA-binding protein
VTTTALACDWSNPSAFIETFRRAFGATPRKFYTDTFSADTRPLIAQYFAQPILVAKICHVRFLDLFESLTAECRRREISYSL